MNAKVYFHNKLEVRTTHYAETSAWHNILTEKGSDNYLDVACFAVSTTELIRALEEAEYERNQTAFNCARRKFIPAL